MMKLAATGRRLLGTTGLRVPPVVFGTRSLVADDGRMSDVAQLELVSAWFDHVAPPVWVSAADTEPIARFLARLEIPPADVVFIRSIDWQEFGQIAGSGRYQIGNLFRPRLLSLRAVDDYLAAAASPDDRQRRLDELRAACQALAELKGQRDIDGVGVEARDPRAIAEIASNVPFDWVALGGVPSVMRYSHELLACLTQLAERKIAVIDVGLLHGGFLTGGPALDGRMTDTTSDIDRPVIAWRKSFVALCGAHGISPLAACVQFSLALPSVVAVSLDVSHADCVADAVAATMTPVPTQFWASLEEEGLVIEQ